MVEIRPARATDGEALVSVHVAAVRELGVAAYESAQVDAWAANKSPDGYPVDVDTAHFVVATRNGTVVGFGHLEFGVDEVQAVYVHPDHARTGVGRALLDHLEATARATGLERLTLLASKNAVEFYEHHGWRGLEWVDHESTGGVVLECLRMEKSVGQSSRSE
ncbi:GNAT family N-acetyltransferase [Natronosalvus caseinilyticus]|uniref:GNAT family N-acetyltransferase n=1 Tax=Natronosalvus caseinilyticus TaxID=2953747 RepID=UPI0028AE925E|nr:GNAT family N-acetyltransferase [Natronosalvus caseinilyticus]